jgi:RNA polymerase sigma factor (sigma-70 family)
VNQNEWIAQQFESHRSHLKAVAYRMLGSLSEADDAVQEAWLRLAQSDADSIVNLGGWLTTVVARVCLDLLRVRKSRAEYSLGDRLPDPIIESEAADPSYEILLADSIGTALLVVLETLPPAERLAFVLHDMFDVPFNEIASIVGRSQTAARQLASRARRRVHTASKVPDVDINSQRKVVDAFLAAARGGGFDALLEVLDPDIVVRADRGPAGGMTEMRGADAVAKQAMMFSKLVEFARPVIINGAAGAISWLPGGKLFSILAFTIRGGKIIELNILVDQSRLDRLQLPPEIRKPE